MSKKQFITTATATPDAKAEEPEMLVTTVEPDRERDRVFPEGADMRGFQRTPSLLWAHRHSDLPIGTVTQLAIEPSRGIRARWRWLKGDEFAERVKNAWDQGVIRAASIGFLPRRSQRNELGGLDHLEWDLTEISLCAVPANPSATRILKGLGLLEENIEIGAGGWRGGDLIEVDEADLKAAIRRVVEKAVAELTCAHIRNAMLRMTGRID